MHLSFEPWLLIIVNKYVRNDGARFRTLAKVKGEWDENVLIVL